MKLRTIAMLATGLALTGCVNTSSLNGDVYSASQAKQMQSVAYGTVVHVRAVQIQAGNDHSVMGGIGGAVLGGFLGNTVGGGTGRSLATAAGSIAGGMIGQKAQQELNKTQGVELEIRKDDGSTIMVVQKQGQTQFAAGQRVVLAGSGNQVTVSPR